MNREVATDYHGVDVLYNPLVFVYLRNCEATYFQFRNKGACRSIVGWMVGRFVGWLGWLVVMMHILCFLDFGILLGKAVMSLLSSSTAVCQVFFQGFSVRWSVCFAFWDMITMTTCGSYPHSLLPHCLVIHVHGGFCS